MFGQLPADLAGDESHFKEVASINDVHSTVGMDPGNRWWFAGSLRAFSGEYNQTLKGDYSRLPIDLQNPEGPTRALFTKW